MKTPSDTKQSLHNGFLTLRYEAVGFILAAL
jgi:hypothetical protein